jgi:hypothetical protein
MLRAGAGLVFGLFILLGALASNVLVANLFALGNVAYCASLLLLLYGNPPARRVLAGRVAFGLSLVLICAALLLIISGIAPPLP